MARIVTLTLNPAVDLACMAPFVRPTHKIRAYDERLDAGGGGINVARVVNTLGGDTLALVMTGGVTGHLIEDLLREAGIPWQALRIRGRNRISVNVHDQETTQEYRFVPEGPEIGTDEWHLALGLLERIEADWIVASGSLPRGVPEDFYARAAGIAARRGQHFALDTSGPALRAAANAPIDLLKVSQGELEFLVDRKLPDAVRQDEQIEALLAGGQIRGIAVSLGPDGAALGTARGIVRLPAMPVAAIGAVGAGDSFLAGLVLALARHQPDRSALAYALCAGAAAVATYGTAQVDRSRVERLFADWCRQNESHL